MPPRSSTWRLDRIVLSPRGSSPSGTETCAVRERGAVNGVLKKPEKDPEAPITPCGVVHVIGTFGLCRSKDPKRAMTAGGFRIGAVSSPRERCPGGTYGGQARWRVGIAGPKVPAPHQRRRRFRASYYTRECVEQRSRS